ncbi:hypothetical protein C8Q78DRAFT_1080554 [Trametes maxima]|nr:hypothetical protein C8Q78DRAFT_1080554 [Trametes maxima]
MINELLGCIDFPHLNLLSVSVLAGAPRCDMVALLQNVGTFCGSLHTLHISCPCIFDGPSGSKQPMGRLSAPAPIDERTLKPLLSLVDIRDLELDIHSPYHIDDALLARVAATWPRLTRLKFGGLYPWGALPSDKHVDPHEASFDEREDDDEEHWGLPEDWVRDDGPSTAWPRHIPRDTDPLRAWSPPPATLTGVLTFLRDCPNITELGVEVDAQSYEVPSTPIHAAQRCVMERLHVGLSPVGDPYAVAAILSDAFPSVRNIQSGWQDLEDHSGQRLHRVRQNQEEWDSAKLYRGAVANGAAARPILRGEVMGPTAFQRFPSTVHEAICHQLILSPRPADHFGIHPNGGYYHTVAALARTCRFLHEPAVNSLWYSIPDIVYLLFTLSRESFHPAGHANLRRSAKLVTGITFEFTEGPIEEADLERLLTYAGRVKVLGSPRSDLPSSTSMYLAGLGVYETLGELLGGRTLLPNLHTLHLDLSSPGQSADTALPYLGRVCLGPQLRRFSLSRVMVFTRTWDQPTRPAEVIERRALEDGRICETLAALCETCPRLDGLGFEWALTSQPVIAGTRRTVLSQKNLTSLVLPLTSVPLGGEVFAHLARLPCLAFLQCYLGRTVFDGSREHTLLKLEGPDALFPALRTSKFGGQTFAMFSELLQSMSLLHLEDLVLSILEETPRRSDVDDLFRTVGALRGKNIRTIRISGVANPYVPDDQQPTSALIDEYTLEPLLALRGIRELEVDVPCPCEIDDLLLARIAVAWPQLSRLELGVRTPWGTGSSSAQRACGRLRVREPPPATLTGLLTLARACPNTTVLGVEFDADPRRKVDPPVHTAPSCKAETLRVGLSLINDPYGVAAYLSHAFPHVRKIESRWDLLERKLVNSAEDSEEEQRKRSSAATYRKQWVRVRQLIPQFVAIREQERAWKNKGVVTPLSGE